METAVSDERTHIAFILINLGMEEEDVRERRLESCSHPGTVLYGGLGPWPTTRPLPALCRRNERRRSHRPNSMARAGTSICLRTSVEPTYGVVIQTKVNLLICRIRRTDPPPDCRTVDRRRGKTLD